MWQFLDETQIGDQYGLNMSTFSIFILYNMIIIPTVMINMVLIHSVNELYQGRPLNDFLDYCKYRFHNRKSSWVYDFTQLNSKIEEKSQRLEVWAFSSQYYFVCALSIMGIFMEFLGFQTWMWNTDFSPFYDWVSLALVFVMWMGCYGYEQLILAIARKLKIWHVYEEKKKPKEDIGLTKEVLETINPKKIVKSPMPAMITKLNLVKVEEDKNEREYAKNELKTERLIASTYRKAFIKNNKDWIKENIDQIITDRTLKVYRKDIISEFKKIFGEMRPKVNYVALPSPTAKREENTALMDYPSSQKKMLTKWLTYARYRREYRARSDKVLEEKIEKTCEFCKESLCLNAHVLNFDEILIEYLSTHQGEEQLTTLNTVISWIMYLKKNAIIKTICINCMELKLRLRNKRIIAIMLKWKSDAQLAMQKKLRFDS